MASLFRVKLGSIVPVDGVIRIGRSVPPDLPVDAGMVSSDTTADLSQRESNNRHMTDDILFFSGKMMVGHDGLLSGKSVGGASLYQKIPSCPLTICHLVHFEVEFT
ncbi:MAG: hypothetical protein ABSG49_12120, partial [Methanoregula sp.]